MTDRPSNTGDDDREDDELDEEEEVEEELTERQILERKVAEARRLYPHLISVHELRLKGALDSPPAWRKSLSAGTRKQRDLFSDLEDEDASAEDMSDEV